MSPQALQFVYKLKSLPNQITVTAHHIAQLVTGFMWAFCGTTTVTLLFGQGGGIGGVVSVEFIK